MRWIRNLETLAGGCEQNRGGIRMRVNNLCAYERRGVQRRSVAFNLIVHYPLGPYPRPVKSRAGVRAPYPRHSFVQPIRKTSRKTVVYLMR
jgi:hypothetical protein